MEITQELKKAIQNDKLILFIGSGMSKKFGFPDWNNLVINILNKLQGDDLDFIPLIQKNKMSALEVLGKLEEEHKTFITEELVANFLKFPDSSDFEFHKKLTNLSSKIVTTNYDRAFEKANEDLYTVNNFDSFNLSQLKKKEGFIFKIHGCISSPENCILFPSQYNQLYSGNEKASIFKLKTLIEGNTFLFLGYSLNDLEINKILSGISNMFNDYSPKHFIISTDDFTHFPCVQNFPKEKLSSYDKLEEIVDNLIKLKNIKHLPIIDKVEIQKSESKESSLSKAIEIFYQEDKKISFNTTKEDIVKLKEIKSKIIEELFSGFDEKIEFITSKKELMLSSIYFDNIYSKSVLDKGIIEEIQKVRNDDENFKWYDRSVIVSGLTLSLIHHDFDINKANLLLDFVSNFEQNVWEKALSGLILGIMVQKNRGWKRSPSFIKRLEGFRENDRIQGAIICIDFILRNELYKESLFDPKFFKNEMFNNPMNCFVPFFENNNIYIDAINNSDLDFDIDFFKNYLKELPLLDCHKYVLCSWLSKGELSKSKLEGKERKIFINKVNISNNFKPYQNILSELYYYFSFYPHERINNVFEKQLLLNKNDLKSLVLEKTNQLLLEANTFYFDGNHKEAISKYENILRIDKNNFEALWQMANSLYAIKKYKESLNIFIKIKDQDEHHGQKDELILRIAECYFKLLNYTESLSYCRIIENGVYKNSFRLLMLLANNYNELKDVSNLILCFKLLRPIATSTDQQLSLASLYETNDHLNEAKELLLTLLENDSKNSVAWHSLGRVYTDLLEFNLSISAMDKAIEFNTKNTNHYILSRCRAMLFSKKELLECKNSLEKLLKPKSGFVDVAYGNLGHYYLIMDNTSQALDSYTKCIKLINNENDFIEKMQIDLKFLLNLGINKEEYIALKDLAVKAFHESNKK